MASVDQPFDPSKFNFTLVKDDEILFRLAARRRGDEAEPRDSNERPDVTAANGSDAGGGAGNANERPDAPAADGVGPGGATKLETARRGAPGPDDADDARLGHDEGERCRTSGSAAVVDDARSEIGVGGGRGVRNDAASATDEAGNRARADGDARDATGVPEGERTDATGAGRVSGSATNVADECATVTRDAVKATGATSDAVGLISTFGDDGDYLAINVSPLESGHCLLLPALRSCLPQVVTVDSLALAVRVVLLSGTPALRAGFNSLCGYASVNHLHYHIYYLRHSMLLETINVVHLSGPCYELVDHPARGFVFHLPARDRDTTQLARSVHRLTRLLHARNVAHNVFVTRGTALDEPAGDTAAGAYDAIRVYVWARTSSAGAKDGAAFNPALCELFGHLNVKQADLYRALTEESVADALADVCRPAYESVRPHVACLYDL